MHSTNGSPEQRAAPMDSTEERVAPTDSAEQPVMQDNCSGCFTIDQIVHEVVATIETHYRQISNYLSPQTPPPPLLSRSGRLYNDISYLIRVANGDIDRSHINDQAILVISSMVQRLVDLLFLPAGGSLAPIPSGFWVSTVTGQMLVRVLGWMQRDDLVSSLVTRSLQADPQEFNRPVVGRRLELRGKTLPVAFTKGLIGSIIDIFGYESGAPELLQLSVADTLPEMRHWQDWFSLVATLNPLYAYYRSDLGIPEPVDYSFLDRLRRAIDKLYPHGDAYLAQQIGWSWWMNDYPLARRWYSSYSLQHVAGSAIVQALQQTKLQPPPTAHDGEARFVWAEEQRIRIACRKFAQVIQHEGGIACTIKERERALLVHFTDCPFCANKMPDCGILFGLIERMLLWLYGERHIDKGAQARYTVCTTATDGLLNVRPAHDDTHAVAIIFGTPRSGQTAHKQKRL